MTKLEKDYNRALERLYVLDEASGEYICAADLEYNGGYVTDDYEVFYTFDAATGEYDFDSTAYYDLIEMQEELDTEFNGDDDEEDF